MWGKAPRAYPYDCMCCYDRWIAELTSDKNSVKLSTCFWKLFNKSSGFSVILYIDGFSKKNINEIVKHDLTMMVVLLARWYRERGNIGGEGVMQRRLSNTPSPPLFINIILYHCSSNCNWFTVPSVKTLGDLKPE